jgi:hypothetical protein
MHVVTACMKKKKRNIKMFAKYWVAVLMLFAVAGCATPHVVESAKSSDSTLDCTQIAGEMRQADRFKKEAQKEKGMTSTNVAAALLFWPAMIGTYSNANEAIAAADLRKVNLMGIFNQKGCNAQALDAQKPLLDHANIGDVLAVPLIKDSGRQAYNVFLTKGYPRAFVIASDGGWSWANGRKTTDKTLPEDPAERAIEMCKRKGHNGCRLYAVDSQVIWTGD